MAMGPSRESTEEAMSEINVTPLVDVMLVLLIIFMVTAPALLQGVNVDLPATRAAPLESKEESLILSVTSDKRIFLGETELPRKNLAEKLKAILAERVHNEIFIRADQSIPYGEVVGLLADLKDAGIAKVGMVTREETVERP